MLSLNLILLIDIVLSHISSPPFDLISSYSPPLYSLFPFSLCSFLAAKNMDNIIRNVIFDDDEPPESLDVAPRPDLPWNTHYFKVLMQIYIVVLLGQYICIYASVPLDDIQGRPSLALIRSVYILIMFSMNACMLPVCLLLHPTLAQFRGFTTLLLLEIVGLGFEVVTCAMIICAGNMLSMEYHKGTSQKVDVTLYIRMVSVASMLLCAIAVGLLTSLTCRTKSWLMEYILYEAQEGLVKPRTELPEDIRREQKRAYTA